MQHTTYSTIKSLACVWLCLLLGCNSNESPTQRSAPVKITQAMIDGVNLPDSLPKADRDFYVPQLKLLKDTLGKLKAQPEKKDEILAGYRKDVSGGNLLEWLMKYKVEDSQLFKAVMPLCTREEIWEALNIRMPKIKPDMLSHVLENAPSAPKKDCNSNIIYFLLCRNQEIKPREKEKFVNMLLDKNVSMNYYSLKEIVKQLYPATISRALQKVRAENNRNCLDELNKGSMIHLLLEYDKVTRAEKKALVGAYRNEGKRISLGSAERIIKKEKHKEKEAVVDVLLDENFPINYASLEQIIKQCSLDTIRKVLRKLKEKNNIEHLGRTLSNLIYLLLGHNKNIEQATKEKFINSLLPIIGKLMNYASLEQIIIRLDENTIRKALQKVKEHNNKACLDELRKDYRSKHKYTRPTKRLIRKVIPDIGPPIPEDKKRVLFRSKISHIQRFDGNESVRSLSLLIEEAHRRS